MTGTARCGTSDLDLLAAACGEAAPATTERIESHLARCEPCREAYTRYRTMDTAIHDLATAASPPADAARERLLESLADLRSRFMHYSVFPTSLGPVLMATTEQGIALVEYVARRDGSDSWLLRQPRVEAAADRSGLERFGSELVDYLAGRRTRLEWPLDLRFARSDFQRDVLAATARVPYGAVSSYGGIASDIGRPSAVRAVAGALRHNPLPIVVPCHRIVGSDGALVGYAGTRLGLKERLLGVEGVRIGHRHRDGEVDRGGNVRLAARQPDVLPAGVRHDLAATDRQRDALRFRARGQRAGARAVWRLPARPPPPRLPISRHRVGSTKRALSARRSEQCGEHRIDPRGDGVEAGLGRRPRLAIARSWRARAAHCRGASAGASASSPRWPSGGAPGPASASRSRTAPAWGRWSRLHRAARRAPRRGGTARRRSRTARCARIRPACRGRRCRRRRRRSPHSAGKPAAACWSWSTTGRVVLVVVVLVAESGPRGAGGGRRRHGRGRRRRLLVAQPDVGRTEHADRDRRALDTVEADDERVALRLRSAPRRSPRCARRSRMRRAGRARAAPTGRAPRRPRSAR